MGEVTAPPGRTPRARLREEQRHLLLAAGVLFAGYYVSFWLMDIYTGASLACGLAMALSLAGAGLLVTKLDDRRVPHLEVAVALVLSIGAASSAAFSGGSHCIGFHTLWALPLIYGLFVHDSKRGAFTIAFSSLLGGLFVLLRDEHDASRIAQWVTLSVSAGVFAFVKQQLSRRNLEFTLSEREQAQTRLATTDRMASVGMLAAGVAHEINNPMAYVTSSIEFAARQVTALQQQAGVKAEDLDEALADAKAGCDRINTIVKTLSRLSRADGGQLGAVDVNATLSDVLRLSRRELEGIVKVTFEPGSVASIPGDESRLGQVFLNLLVNGAQAVEQRPEGPRTLVARTFPRGNAAVVVEFTDSGCGIPAASLARIFDPFFTTKPPGKGTGLGLSVCAEIVEQHHGSIEVESAPGKGSTFRVVLPSAA